MINLKELTFSFKPDNWLNTFVGIKKNVESDKFEFQLPKGFQNFPINNYTSVKSLFFKTYKTYRKFFEEKKNLAEDNQLDGFSELENGYSIEGKDGQTVSYSKLNMLDSILDAYNELLILSIKNKLSKTSEVDYSKIHKYLHKAIFIDEETVFVDEMEFLKKIIDTDSPALIQMFCFIYAEIKQALEEEFESNRVKTLSTEFRESYLTHESSIFDEDTFEETMAILKDILDEIDRSTAYKDADYWHFYDAIYKFLYGENEDPNDDEGNVWGMTNFAVLWEELCFADAKQRLTETQLLFADRIGVIETFNNFQNPFFVQINSHKDKKRFLRPDLVYTNFTGAVELEHFKRIYNIQEIKIQEFVNVKLTPKFQNHDFYELDNIYLKYVNRNPKHIQNPNEDRFLNVTSNHRIDFFEEINKYFTSLSLSELMLKKPCVFNFTVIDYKYISEESCVSNLLSGERKLDIQKQLVYEFALQLNYFGSWTYSEFWIPYFFEDDEKDFEAIKNLNKNFTDAKIVIYKRNFLKLQELYIQDNE
jgi:hypothetical protein